MCTRTRLRAAGESRSAKAPREGSWVTPWPRPPKPRIEKRPQLPFGVVGHERASPQGVAPPGWRLQRNVRPADPAPPAQALIGHCDPTLTEPICTIRLPSHIRDCADAVCTIRQRDRHPGFPPAASTRVSTGPCLTRILPSGSSCAPRRTMRWPSTRSKAYRTRCSRPSTARPCQTHARQPSPPRGVGDERCPLRIRVSVPPPVCPDIRCVSQTLQPRKIRSAAQKRDMTG